VCDDKRLTDRSVAARRVVPMDLVLIREVRAKAGGDHGDKAARSFQLVRLDVKKVHTIRAKNKAEKDEWTKDLQKIVNQYLAKLQEVQKIPQVHSLLLVASLHLSY
jgi:hypothetical protein